MYYGYWDPTIIILIPAMVFAFICQGRVQSAFRRYSRVRNRNGLTGAQAARRVLDRNGLGDVRIVPISGNLTDNYNPANRTLNLSESVYNVPSVSAVSVACHEAGHAIQHARGYVPLTVRNSIVPVVNFASSSSWILIMVGLVLMFSSGPSSSIGTLIFNIGVIAFVIVLLFHLITLPVEFNASRRALAQMEKLALVEPEDMKGSRRVLRAAAMTYVAAVAVAAANLLRILALSRRD